MTTKLTHINDRHGDAEVHKAGCAHLNRGLKDNVFTFDVETRLEAVKHVWGMDMIQEDMANEDLTEAEALNRYLHNTKFAPCLKDLK